LRSLNDVERKHFVKTVGEIYGDHDYLKSMELLMSGQGRVRACTRETLDAAQHLEKVLTLGVYVAKWRKWGVMLTVEGTQMLQGKTAVNVVDLDDESAQRWMSGAPVRLMEWRGQKIVVGRYRGFLLGSAIVDREAVAYPQIPKWRRVQDE